MGRRINYSNGRRLVADVIRIAKRFPSAGIGGDFDTSEVAKLRRLTRPKISWNVLCMKAYANVAKKYPPLRQLYVGFPWPHLYEHQQNVCMMTISREFQGEERLFFARFNQPESFSLANLQERYDHFRYAPIHEIRQFRHQINFAKAPAVVRKLGWWLMFNVWPAKRASQVGTFGISISGYKGSRGFLHLGPLTAILGVDPMPRKGIAYMLLTFDHRVLDGAPATSVLQQLHLELTTTIRTELESMIKSQNDFDSQAKDLGDSDNEMNKLVKTRNAA